MVWGLDSHGKFVTENHQKSTSHYVYNMLGLRSNAASVYQAVLDDIKRVRTSVDLQVERSTYLSDREKGKELMLLFQCDLLPGVSGKILETKGNRDQKKVGHIPGWLKVVGWGFIILLNSAMLFYIFLFALNQNSTRQEAWFRSFVVWLVLDIVFVSTAEVVFTHILVPSLIMKDVMKIKQRMVENISAFNKRLQQKRKNHPNGDQNEKVAMEMLKETSDQFNAASYLFVSSRVAVNFMYLREAQLIMNFVTPWPRQSYQRINDVSKKYNKTMSAVQRSVSTIIFFFINGLIDECAVVYSRYHYPDLQHWSNGIWSTAAHPVVQHLSVVGFGAAVNLHRHPPLCV